MLEATDEYAERLMKNTLRSLQGVTDLSPRCAWKIQELLDFIAKRSYFKEAYFHLFKEKLEAFNKRKLSETTDVKPAKRRITTLPAP